MKNHRFPWLRNRTTDNRKCEKARNIKGKRTIEMFSRVLKQLVAHHSSARDNQYYLFKAFLMECLFLLHDEVGAKNSTALMTAELSAVYYFLLCLFIKSRDFCFCMPLSTV